MASTKSVLVIDMAAEVENLPEKLVKACEEFGYFRLKNHGIPAPLMADMKAVARSLVDLPPETKMRNANPTDPSKGYTTPNVMYSFYDSLSLYDTASPASIEEFCAQMDASPHQREIISKYTSAMNDLVQLIGGMLMEGLGFGREKFKGGTNQLRMNNYRYGPETVGLNGAAMHSDAGLFTILMDDDVVKGLEAVDKTTGELIPIDPVPGTLVFNIGDVGKVWSNGRFHNVKHQVICYDPNIRTSLPLFVLPPKDEKVEVMPELVDEQHPPLYVPFDFEHYRKLRISTKSPYGEALELFRSSHQDVGN